MREQERKRREQESLERQALAMSVERFAIPEVLFRPSDIGLDCGGIAEAILGAESQYRGALSAVAAVFMVQIIVATYIYMAFREDTGDGADGKKRR